MPLRFLARVLSPAVDPIRRRLPTQISRGTKWLAWATLISNVGIILTGGAVRLTASGLGCPEWPRCTADSWISTPEMGMHGAIEFGNRMLTYVLVAICAAMFLALVRLWETHRSLVGLSIFILCGIPLQAVIGGITVWTNLNPWVVALHFLASAALVMAATMLLLRVKVELKHNGETGRPLVDGPSDGFARTMASVVIVSAWAAVVVGTVVTGTGPHAGDPGSPRHEFDAEFVTRLHVIPVYILCAATIAIIARQRMIGSSPAQQRAAWFLVAVIVAQGIIGYWQHWTGLPIGLVWVHMLGSALTVVAATMVYDRHRATYRTRGLGTPAEQPTTSTPPAVPA